jgi:hypothetical protein
MAKKATAAKAAAKPRKKATAKPKRAASAQRASSQRRKAAESEFNVGDALIKLMESPLIADLLAVGATAALAAITETRSGRRDDPSYKSSRAVKAAGKAAAAAMGRRLATELEEIQRAAKESRGKRGA